MSDIPGTIVTTHDELRALHPHTYLVIQPLASAVASPWSAEDLMRWHDDQDMDIKVIPAVVMIDGYEYDAHRDALLNSDAYRSPLMPEQTPVTDDDRSAAYEWAASLDPDMRCWTDRERAAARVILATVPAHVPAPPATLADELRTASWGDIPALADRVEAVEKERDEARTKVEEVEGHLSKSWRQRDAKDVELERLSREREQQEKALVEHGRLLAEARAEVERLTVSLNRQCTTVTPSVHNTDALTASNDTLPDPADVPLGSAYQVSAPVWGTARTLTGVKTGTDRWVVYSPSGETGTRHNSEIELRARLVPEVAA